MCCISLRTRCLIVGWLQIIFSVTSITFSLYLAIMSDKLFANDPNMDVVMEVGFVVLIVVLALHLSSLAISVLLIQGIVQNRAELMTPFIYGQIVILIMFVSFSIVDAIFELRDGDEAPYSLNDFIFEGTYVVLTILFIWPVYSFHKEIIDSRRRQWRRIRVADNANSCVQTTEV